MVAAAVLDFKHLKNVTPAIRQKANVHHPAQFHRNRSSGCGEMAISRFFKMAAVRHLGFATRVFGPSTNSIW